MKSLSVAGRRVPFNPLRLPGLPIRSRRIGLRTIPSIGGKAAPTERITNGTFELGNLTGWDNYGAAVTTEQAHAGSYSAVIAYGERFSQTLAAVVAQADIFSFLFWAYPTHQRAIDFVSATITYSDASDDSVAFADLSMSLNQWNEGDLLPYVDSGKSVETIKFSNADSYEYHKCHIDDVSLLAY